MFDRSVAVATSGGGGRASGSALLLRRLCCPHTVAAKPASCLQAAARWGALCRVFRPVHAQEHVVLPGSLLKCRAANQSKCRRGLEERSESGSWLELNGQRPASACSICLVAYGQSLRS